jgi:hypothetical protein
MVPSYLRTQSARAVARNDVAVLPLRAGSIVRSLRRLDVPPHPISPPIATTTSTVAKVDLGRKDGLRKLAALFGSEVSLQPTDGFNELSPTASICDPKPGISRIDPIGIKELFTGILRKADGKVVLL